MKLLIVIISLGNYSYKYILILVYTCINIFFSYQCSLYLEWDKKLIKFRKEFLYFNLIAIFENYI